MNHLKFPLVLAAIALVISAVGCCRGRHNLAASRSRTYSVVCADRDILLTDGTLADPQHDFHVCPGDRITWHYPGHQFSVDFTNSPEGDPFGATGLFVATKGIAQ